MKHFSPFSSSCIAVISLNVFCDVMDLYCQSRMLKCLTESFSQTAIFLVVPQLVLLHQNLLLKWKFLTFILLNIH